MTLVTTKHVQNLHRERDVKKDWVHAIGVPLLELASCFARYIHGGIKT